MKQILDPGESPLIDNSKNNHLQSANQMKLIVFLVDEIDQNKPNVESVWAVNLFFDDPRQLTFIPLTDSSEKDFKKLSGRFYLNEKNELSESTMNSFEKYFLTSWDGSIIIDRNTVSYFFSWLTENQITVTGALSNNSSESDLKFHNLTYLCDYLNNKTTNLSNPIDWQNISSKDFITSLSIDEVLLGLETMTGETPPKCKFIPNNQ